MINIKLSALLLASFLLMGCPKDKDKPHSEPIENQKEREEQVEFGLNDFLSKNKDLENLANQIFNQISDKEKAAQLITIAENQSAVYPDFDVLMNDGIAGGMLYLKLGNSRLKTLNSNFNSYPKGKTKTLFMADAEPSLMKYKFLDYKERIPNTIDISADKIQFYTQKIDSVLEDYHVKLNLGTVGDLGKNTDVIKDRAWGKTAYEVISEASQHIKITQKDNIGATLKHFPGHGNISGDSHKNLVTIDGELSELENFEKIIDKSNPSAVLIGHIAIKNNQEFNSDLPATLNEKIIKNLLRNSLNYNGLIVTDAMNMSAISNIRDADFKALVAGNDIVLIPKNPRELNQKIQEVLQDKNHENHQQFVESVKRVIRFKICTGLIQ